MHQFTQKNPFSIKNQKFIYINKKKSNESGKRTLISNRSKINYINSLPPEASSSKQQKVIIIIIKFPVENLYKLF